MRGASLSLTTSTAKIGNFSASTSSFESGKPKRSPLLAAALFCFPNVEQLACDCFQPVP
jgi:hypothetical protein